jgi:hypothetical protein
MLHELGNHFEGALMPERLDTFRELVDVGEPKVALEILGSNINDFELEVDPAIRGLLHTACTRLDVLVPPMSGAD